MGNTFKHQNIITDYKYNKNVDPIEESTQTNVIQLMQSNRYHTSIPFESISKPELASISPITNEDKDKSFKKNFKPKNYELLLRQQYPLGMHKIDNLFVYNFWGPESSLAIKDFVEVHSIPVYELNGKRKFYRYCNENKWFNTAEKFKTVWKSVQDTNSRLICGIKSKFDIIVDVSDCFYDGDGSLMRAYSIKGGDEATVLRAFSYLSDTWRISFHRDTKWHHDCAFNYYNPEIIEKPKRRDSCGHILENIIADSEFDVIDRNNANNRQTLKRNSLLRNGSNSMNYIFVTIPKNDEFDLDLFDEKKFKCKIFRETGLLKQQYDVIIIEGISKHLEKLKSKLQKYLKKRYISTEKYFQF